MNNKCCCKCNADCDNCIQNILQVICMIQADITCNSVLNSCDRPVLGNGTTGTQLNTRPIMLYTCAGNGSPWQMPTTRVNTDCTSTGATGCSNVFRVEKCDGCCATFRVLEENPDETSPYPYVATDSIFTMNTNCLCSVRCLEDTYVECL